MPGDLEEFLRRAAERRAQKQQQGGGNRPVRNQPARTQPVRREYSDARRERQVHEPVDESIPIAEVVETPISSLEQKRQQVEEAKRRAEAARKKLAKAQRSKLSSSTATSQDAIQLQGDVAEQLLQLLRNPDGVKQAFLLREVLDRPDFDRW